MHLPGGYVDFRFSFSTEKSSKARSALEQLFGDGKFGDGSLAQPEKEVILDAPPSTCFRTQETHMIEEPFFGYG